MTKKHPNDGPTFGHGKPVKRQRPAPDPAREKAALDQAARDSEDLKLLRTDPKAWLKKKKLIK
jgi:hypothetical protein